MAIKLSNGAELTVPTTVKTSLKALSPSALPATIKKRRSPTLIPISTYEKLFSFVARGDSLKRACERPRMPKLSTAWERIKSDPAVKKLYDAAVETSIEMDLDRVIELADSALDGYAPTQIKAADRIAARKLAISTRIQLAEMKLRDKYGPVNAMTIANGSVSINIVASPTLADTNPAAVDSCGVVMTTLTLPDQSGKDGGGGNA